jgi:hypothetical protein
MKTYRVVSDGYRFKIQKYTKHPFWIPFIIPKHSWVDLKTTGDYGSFTTYYSNFEAAVEACERCAAYEKKKTEWTSVYEK